MPEAYAPITLDRRQAANPEKVAAAQKRYAERQKAAKSPR